MKCTRPHVGRDVMFPCGNCHPCRVNKRRLWSTRIMLETMGYEDNTFVTLTYNEQELPLDDDGIPTLVIEDYQKFMKKLRRSIAPVKVRYFFVGEYGEKTQRPHYHAILFGYPNCEKGRSEFNNRGSCCLPCDLVAERWSRGNVLLGEVNPKSALYCASYTLKKMTDPDDGRLHGRYPEFARMSLRPGLGQHMMHEVASTLMTIGLRDDEDVPATLRLGGKEWPLGRYLRSQLRMLIGREPGAHEATIKAMVEELQGLRQEATDNDTPVVPYIRKKMAGLERKAEAKTAFYRRSSL